MSIRVTSAAGVAMTMSGVCIALVAFAGCTTEDGEGARYTGRVVSVFDRRLCVGPNTSSSAVTCGSVPREIVKIPSVGQCVSLFSKHRDDKGQVLSWTADSLRLKVSDSKCGPT